MLCAGTSVDPRPRKQPDSGHRTAKTAKKRSPGPSSRPSPPAKRRRTQHSEERPLTSKRHGQASNGSALQVSQLSLQSYFASVTPAATYCRCTGVQIMGAMHTLCGSADMCCPSARTATLLPCLPPGCPRTVKRVSTHPSILLQACREPWLSKIVCCRWGWQSMMQKRSCMEAARSELGGTAVGCLSYRRVKTSSQR